MQQASVLVKRIDLREIGLEKRTLPRDEIAAQRRLLVELQAQQHIGLLLDREEALGFRCGSSELAHGQRARDQRDHGHEKYQAREHDDAAGSDTRRSAGKPAALSHDLEATPRVELGNGAFAELCLTTWLRRHPVVER